MANPSQQDVGHRLYNFVLLALIGGLLLVGLRFILTTVGLGEVVKTFGLGLLTLARVLVWLVVATLIWTPIGVAIGFNPRIARLLQPVVQFLASFPANFIFPFATLFFIRSHISIDWGSILLMSLGAQW
jgi:NitT/TauT family transport system permease protein